MSRAPDPRRLAIHRAERALALGQPVRPDDAKEASRVLQLVLQLEWWDVDLEVLRLERARARAPKTLAAQAESFDRQGRRIHAANARLMLAKLAGGKEGLIAAEVDLELALADPPISRRTAATRVAKRRDRDEDDVLRIYHRTRARLRLPHPRRRG